MVHAGTGKTLTYLLPVIHQLKHQEDAEKVVRRVSRPRYLLFTLMLQHAKNAHAHAKYTCTYTCMHLLNRLINERVNCRAQKEIDQYSSTSFTALETSDDSFIALAHAHTCFLFC